MAYRTYDRGGITAPMFERNQIRDHEREGIDQKVEQDQREYRSAWVETVSGTYPQKRRGVDGKKKAARPVHGQDRKATCAQ